jgi:hypothetical protein
VKDDVDVLHEPGDLLGIPDVGQETAAVVVPGESLLQKEKLALVVVKGDHFGDGVILQELADELGTDRAAAARDQDTLVAKIGVEGFVVHDSGPFFDRIYMIRIKKKIEKRKEYLCDR